MNEMIRLAVAMLFAALPIACSGPASAPVRPPLEGARIGGPFDLVDQDGKPFGERNLAGKYSIVYFGYTFCPDVCPVAMQNLSAGLRAVDRDDAALGAKIVPVFVTVDPARDTPAVLKQFVGNFHPRLVGLTGTSQQIAAMAKEYAVYFKRGAASPGGGYMMDHSDVAYLMGPDGKPIALLPQNGTPSAIADELKRWVR